jgi:hypothetical protein
VLSEQLVPLHTAAEALYDLMVKNHDVAIANMFAGSWLLYVRIHRWGCDAINSTAWALKSDTTASVSIELLDDALSSLRQIFQAERSAEGLKWKGLYGYEHLVDFFNVECLLEEYRQGVVDTCSGKGEGSVLSSSSSSSSSSARCTMENGHDWHQGTGQWSSWFSDIKISTIFPLLNKPLNEWSLVCVV